ncbi:EAL domain-containing protein [Sphingomonas koreensis]|uniref:sensor domain-containing protein n=1 Tax=Sphingomonas koreensis TaxID=93064 RepID=UPI0008376A3F|nr:EAL domain-containing protein [Sphingomonas koreensis]PJI90370.1 diguanylate cyclase (GGDEF)-like protein [Sphingomonas koreensis]RSU61166.1 EAL domain-containing protein [Sphingomonas koreensis]RSU69810.1 EAL domain-containing protein [Sphingomonas koreensis]
MIGAKIRPQRKLRNGGNAAPHPAQGELLASIEGLRTNWFWSTDGEGRLSYISDWVADEFAIAGQGIAGSELTAVFRIESDAAETSGPIGFLLAKQKPFRGVNMRCTHDRQERIWTMSGSPQFDHAGNFTGFQGIGADITAVQESAEAISRLASHDALTGLRNRRGISALVEQALLASMRSDRSFAILLVDLDRFKLVNDTLGHPAGDQLLTQVAARLSRVLNHEDCVGRIGGDEFQIVLSVPADRNALAALAEDIIRTVSQPYFINGSRCVIGASIGIVLGPHDGDMAEDLIRNADLALYAAKDAGRGCYRFFARDMLEAAEDRRLLEQDLLDALDRGELEVNYQPLVNAKTNVIAGFEALLRWNHPDRGRISPALFIPIAEETSLIARLGEWTMRQACVDAATWPGDLRVAVNVSPIQFANPSLPQVVLSALAHSGLNPERLELEITESVFIDGGAEAEATFATLKKIGVRLALDDFGTGYSSLGYLRSAPFDKIKIDQSFVRLVADPASRNNAIITAIVALARTLGMETTAEGVESLDQLEALRALDVGLIQGYLYSLPVSAAAAMEMVAEAQPAIQPIGPAKQRGSRVATFRRIGAVHGDHYYPVILRNLSRTGALIEGLVDVPVGTRFVIDFGDRQWTVATVRRSRGTHQGVEFDEPLVSDGQGGYRTRYRVSSMMLAQLGLSLDRSAERGCERPMVQSARQALPVFQTSLR